MNFIWSVISKDFYLFISQPILQIASWLIFAILTFYIVIKLNDLEIPLNRSIKIFIIVLFIITPFTSLFLGIEVFNSDLLPIPYIPINVKNYALLLIYVPILAAGIYAGPKFSVILAVLAGSLNALFITHNPFTIFIYTTVALLFTFMMRQNYSMSYYKYLREPMIASAFLSLFYPILDSIATFLFLKATFIVRLEYFLSHLFLDWKIFIISLIIPTLIAQIIKIFVPQLWVSTRDTSKKRENASIIKKMYYSLIPVMLLILSFIGLLSWNLLENRAQQKFKDILKIQTENSSHSIQMILNTGQSLIQQYSLNDSLIFDDQNTIETYLKQQLTDFEFFNSLHLLNANGQQIAGYPETDINKIILSTQETNAIVFALNEVPFQVYPVNSLGSSTTTQLSFIVPVLDQNEIPYRVLIGRYSFDDSSHAESLLDNFSVIEQLGGVVYILTPQNQVIYHTNQAQLFKLYELENFEINSYFEEINSVGIRELYYRYLIPENGWQIISSIETNLAGEEALELFLPLISVILVSFIIILLLIRMIVRRTYSSISDLAKRTDKVLQDEFEHFENITGNDEISKLSRKLEMMRKKFLSLIKEQKYILNINQTDDYDFKNITELILESALIYGAETAKLVLYKENSKNLSDIKFSSYQKGKLSDKFNGIDAQILYLLNDEPIQLFDSSNKSSLVFEKEMIVPDKILVSKIYQNSKEIGFIWVAYIQSHFISEQEMNYFKELALQTSIVLKRIAKNQKTLETNKPLMDAIKNHPDGIFLVNKKEEIILLNDRAKEILEIQQETEDLFIEAIPVIKNNKRFYFMFRGNPDQEAHYEIKWSDGRIFNINVTKQDQANNQDFIWVCVMRDITKYRVEDVERTSYIQSITNNFRHSIKVINDNVSMISGDLNLSENQSYHISKITEQSNYLSQQANQMLTLEKIKSGYQINIKENPLLESLQIVKNRLSSQMSQKSVAMHITSSSGIKTGYYDKNLFEIALFNILENAVKYSYRDGKVQIELSSVGDVLIIAIKDDGIGMTLDDSEKIFSSYYQVTDAVNESHGIGLSIAKFIIEKHNGTIQVTSSLGKGSVFTIKLPNKEI